MDSSMVLVRNLKSWYKYFPPFAFQIINGEGVGEVDMLIDLSPNLDGTPRLNEGLEFIRENFAHGERFTTADLKPLGLKRDALLGRLARLVETRELERSGRTRGACY